MSQPAPERAPEQSRPGGPPKVLGMNRTTLIIFGVALGGAILYFLYTRKQSASPSTGQGAATGSCTDANGNPTPCEEMAGVDYSGQLSVLQTELESLLAAESNEPAATTTGSGGTSTTGTGTGTTTTTPPPKAKQPTTPSNLHTTKVTATAISLAWSGSQNANGYNVRITYQSSLLKQIHVGGTSATVSGLTRNHTYGVHVLATSNTAPWSPEASIVVKTPLA